VPKRPVKMPVPTRGPPMQPDLRYERLPSPLHIRGLVLRNRRGTTAWRKVASGVCLASKAASFVTDTSSRWTAASRPAGQGWPPGPVELSRI